MIDRVFRLLEGKTVNSRIIEKEDLHSVAEWADDLEFGVNTSHSIL